MSWYNHWMKITKMFPRREYTHWVPTEEDLKDVKHSMSHGNDITWEDHRQRIRERYPDLAKLVDHGYITWRLALDSEKYMDQGDTLKQATKDRGMFRAMCGWDPFKSGEINND